MDDNFPTKVILRQKPKICLLPFVTTPLVIVFCCLYVVAHRRRRWQLWCVTQLWRQCPVHLWPWSSVVRLSVQPRICRYTCISCSAYAHRQASLFFVQSYNQQYDVGPINQEVKTRNMGGGSRRPWTNRNRLIQRTCNERRLNTSKICSSCDDADDDIRCWHH